MAYTVQAWDDSPATDTPLNSARLAHMEAGIEAAAATADAAATPASVTQRGITYLGAPMPHQFRVSRRGGGQDDGAAIAAAIASATTYALNNQGYGEVLLDDVSGAYLANTAPTTGGSFAGNAIIPVQPVPVAGLKPVVKIRGASSFGSHSLAHWSQAVPQAAGTVIATTRSDGTNDASNGPAFVLGGPRNGYGGGSSLFSNMLLVVDGITIQVPWNGTYGGFGLYGLAEAEIVSASCMAAGTPASMSDPGSITNMWPIGLQMPDTNNNDLSSILRYSSEGMPVGAHISEHATFGSIRCIYCVAAVQAGSASGTPMPHGIRGDYLSAEICDSALVGAGATSKINIAQVDTESVSDAVYDPNGYLTGEIGLRGNNTPGYGTFAVNGAPGLRVIALDMARGPVASPPAVPASGTALANLFYRDATVWVRGGTVTGIAIDGTTLTGVTSGPVRVPSGHSITITYSAAPAWQWVLD